MGSPDNFDHLFPQESGRVLAIRKEEIPENFKSKDVIGFRFDDPESPNATAWIGCMNHSYSLEEVATILKERLGGKIHLIAEGLNHAGVDALINFIYAELQKEQKITREKVLQILTTASKN